MGSAAEGIRQDAIRCTVPAGNTDLAPLNSLRSTSRYPWVTCCKRYICIVAACLVALAWSGVASAANVSSWLTPLDGATISGNSVELRITATNDTNDISGAIVYACGGAQVITLNPSGTDEYAGTLDSTLCANGSTTIAGDVYFGGGFSFSSALITVTIDNSAPTATTEEEILNAMEWNNYAMGMLLGAGLTIWALNKAFRWWLP